MAQLRAYNANDDDGYDDESSYSYADYQDEEPSPRKPAAVGKKKVVVEDYELDSPVKDKNDVYDYPDRDYDKDRENRRSQMSAMSHNSGMSSMSMISTLSEVVRRDILLTSPYERTFYGQNAIAEEKIRPYFMIFALLLNVILFIYTMSVADWQIADYRINPMIGPEAAILDQVGAKNTQRILDGEWWRLFSPMWLHSGVIHLLMNMVVLYRLGFGFEELYGGLRIGPIYVISGILGNVTSAIFLPTLLSVGASSALYGLFGALFGDYLHNHRTMDPESKGRYLLGIVAWTIIGLLIGLLPWLDNFAHIGGFVTGFIVSLITLYDPPTNLQVGEVERELLVPSYSRWLALAGVIGIIAWSVMLIAILYGDQPSEEWCPGCSFLNCIEAPIWDCDNSV